MKKSLLKVLPISLALALFTQVNFAQTSCLVMDSVSAGNGASSYRLYTYDLQNRLVKVVEVDSGGMLATANYDTLMYGTNGMVSSVENRDGSSGALLTTFTVTYNSSDLVSTMVHGDAAGTWGMTHTVAYNGSEMTEMIVSNVTGNPEGLAASFTNVMYTGGNLTSLHLEGDLTGMGATDTFELSLTYDTYNNLEQSLAFTEASDLLSIYNSNNIVTIVFDNEEYLGPDTIPAGTVAMQSSYQYDTDNNVSVLAELPGVFSDKPNTREYSYDCTQLSISEHKKVMVDLYPNPFTGSIQVNLEELNGESFDLVLVNILGVEVLNERYTGVSTVNLEGLEKLNNGLYFLQVKFGDRTITRKLVKK